ncbi:MAG: MATE family efflux transporter [Clostridia bacterium]|nr:MATE family efflux transporter [Clostridia bacterium]
MQLLSRYVGDRAFYRRALAVAVPIMLQNGITNFVSMLDNIMVGNVDTWAMTGVAVANQLMFVYMLCLFGAVSGAGIFGAQFFGKGDKEGLCYSFRFKLLLCAVLTVAATAIFWFAGEPMAALFLQGEGTPAQAAAALAHAKSYMRIMLIGMIPNALIQCYASTLRETGETVLPMKAGITAVLVNLFFNYVLIFGHFGAPKLGVEGAAIATVISRFVEVAIVMIWTHRRREAYSFVAKAWRSPRIPGRLTLAMLSKGAPLMINEALWSAGITMVNQCYSVRGLNVVAAMNISQTFWNVFSVTFMAIGTAIGIIVGQMLGAEEFEEARDTDRKLIAFSLFVSVIIGVVYAIAAQFIPMLYNTSADVRTLASGVMTISACMMPLTAFCHASYFTLRSGGKTVVTFLFDSCFVWVLNVPLAFLLSRYTGVDILLLYACCQGLELIKCILGGILLKKGVWVRSVVSDQ